MNKALVKGSAIQHEANVRAGSTLKTFVGVKVTQVNGAEVVEAAAAGTVPDGILAYFEEMGETDTNVYAAGARVKRIVPAPGSYVNVRVPANSVAIVFGDDLVLSATGFIKAGAGHRVARARGAAPNLVGAEQVLQVEWMPSFPT